MSKLFKILLSLLIIAFAGFFVLRWLVERVSPMPSNLGVRDGRLAPCPESPNCVSTFADDDQHRIAPLPLTGDADEARSRLLSVIASQPRSEVITSDENYIHAEFRSAIWGFIDDVEFYLDEENNLIHFRSASRLGYGDGGVNRNRMETIRMAYQGS